MLGQYFCGSLVCLCWVDFRKDGKEIRENGRENIFGGCLVGGRRGKKLVGGEIGRASCRERVLMSV